ncbi:MAG: phosphoribosyltransferase [Gammaproteobacteria bacterium]|nr:phosphoribosyltransferase [Gammaproteobacteria bacterium]
MKIELNTGSLDIASDDPGLLQTLTGFGSRANKKRGFIFVSKVLGKHYPVKPSAMGRIYDQLAALIRNRLNGPTMVVGFAETATGLGCGVYHQLGLPDAFYIHTTRHKLSQPVWLDFQEEHCHAPGHLLYEPADEQLRELRDQVKNVVLIDDEFSTGRTLANLAAQLRKHLPHAEYFMGASILSWMPQALPDIPCVSLHQGQFKFSQKNGVPVASSISVAKKNAAALDGVIPHNFARQGIRATAIDYRQCVETAAYCDKKVLVLGTGEFMYPAYLLAKHLEDNGADVRVQSTTRSPLNVDGDICNKLHFRDNYHGQIDNFLYNIDSYEKIIICYETVRLPAKHRLKALVAPHAREVVELFMKPAT